MPTERIEIVFSSRGARTVRRDLTSIGAGARGAQGAVQLLRSALGALAVSFGAREIIRAADTFTNLQNRLRLVTNNTTELAQTTDALFRIANQTRQSFEATTTVFTRTALATRQLGLTQQQTLQFTESLNQAVVLSGAGAQEATNALIQLSQGLQSGELRGEEFRSVSEQLPIVLDVVAESLGVARDEIRELAFDGQITAGVIIRAFQDAREELAERFAETVPTISQSFQVLRNNFLRLVGEFDTANGITRVLAQGILFLAQNLESVATFAVQAGAALALAFTPRLVSTVFSLALGVGRLLLALGPIGLAVGAIVTLSLALEQLDGALFTVNGTAVQFGDVVQAVFTVGLRVVNALGEGLRVVLVPAFRDLGFEVDNLRDILGVVINGIAGFVDTVIGFVVGLVRAVRAALSGIPDAFEEVFIDAANASLEAVEGLVNGAADLLNNLPGVDIGRVTFDRFENEVDGALRDLGTRVVEAFQSGQDIQVAQGFIELVREEAVAIAQRREALEAEAAARDQVAEATTNFIPVAQEAKEASLTLEDTFVNAFGRAEDALVEFVTTGKLEFGDLFRSIASDFARLGIRQIVTGLFGGNFLGGNFSAGGGNPLSSLFGGGGLGSLFGSIGSLLGFQDGVQGLPVNAVSVGALPGATDNRLVAFRARSDETIDVNRRGERSGGGITVNFNFMGPADAASFQASRGQIAADLARTIERASSRDN